MFKEIKLGNFEIKSEKIGNYLIEYMGDKIFEGGWEIAYPITELEYEYLFSLFREERLEELRKEIIRIRADYN